jgi:hypothetical protein
VTVAAVAPRRALAGVPTVVIAAIATAWAAALAAEATGAAALLHHDALVEDGPAVWVAMPVFLLAWQVMIAAMMLPSSLPLVRLFAAASAGQPHARRAIAGFLAATRSSGRRSARSRSRATSASTPPFTPAPGCTSATGSSAARCLRSPAPSSSRS